MRKHIFIIALLVFSVGFLSTAAFIFVSKQKLSDVAGSGGGFTAMASSASSAVAVSLTPEPTTIVMLGIGSLALVRRKK